MLALLLGGAAQLRPLATTCYTLVILRQPASISTAVRLGWAATAQVHPQVPNSVQAVQAAVLRYNSLLDTISAGGGIGRPTSRPGQPRPGLDNDAANSSAPLGARQHEEVGRAGIACFCKVQTSKNVVDVPYSSVVSVEVVLMGYAAVAG